MKYKHVFTFFSTRACNIYACDLEEMVVFDNLNYYVNSSGCTSTQPTIIVLPGVNSCVLEYPIVFFLWFHPKKSIPILRVSILLKKYSTYILCINTATIKSFISYDLGTFLMHLALYTFVNVVTVKYRRNISIPSIFLVNQFFFYVHILPHYHN